MAEVTMKCFWDSKAPTNKIPQQINIHMERQLGSYGWKDYVEDTVLTAASGWTHTRTAVYDPAFTYRATPTAVEGFEITVTMGGTASQGYYVHINYEWTATYSEEDLDLMYNPVYDDVSAENAVDILHILDHGAHAEPYPVFPRP